MRRKKQHKYENKGKKCKMCDRLAKVKELCMRCYIREWANKRKMEVRRAEERIENGESEGESGWL